MDIALVRIPFREKSPPVIRSENRVIALQTQAVGEKLATRVPAISEWRLIGGAALVSRLKHRRSYNINFVPGTPQASVDAIVHGMADLRSTVRSCEPNRTFPVDTFEIDGIVVTFGRAGCLNFGRSTDPIVIDQAQITNYGHIRVVDLPTVFDLKLIVAMQRHHAVDLYDLWYMTHRMRDSLPIDWLPARLSVLRPEITFAAMRDRLCGQPYADWNQVSTKGQINPKAIIDEMLDSMHELEMRISGIIA